MVSRVSALYIVLSVVIVVAALAVHAMAEGADAQRGTSDEGALLFAPGQNDALGRSVIAMQAPAQSN